MYLLWVYSNCQINIAQYIFWEFPTAMAAKLHKVPRQAVQTTGIIELIPSCPEQVSQEENKHGLWFKISSLLRLHLKVHSLLNLFSFTFQLHCIQTAEGLRTQRFNWADNGLCCEPQLCEPHILVIGIRDFYSRESIKLIMHLTPANWWTWHVHDSLNFDQVMKLGRSWHGKPVKVGRYWYVGKLV